MNESYNMTYFSKSLNEIPWHFPDICPFTKFPWHFFKFPDNSLTLKKNIFSLTFPWRVATLQRREWILDELCNRFCTMFTTDSWQRTPGHDECVHKMTNIIHNYWFVKPYIIHNIALTYVFLCRYASFSVPQTLRFGNCLLINSSSYVYLCRCSPRL